MSDDGHEKAPAKSGGGVERAGSGARRRPSLFMIATMIAGAIAMSLIVWRISRAWRIEYGGGAPGAKGIPTTGSFGAPGAPGLPQASSGTVTAPPPSR